MDSWAEILRKGTLACQIGAKTERTGPVPVLSASDHVGGRTLEKKPKFILIIIKEVHNHHHLAKTYVAECKDGDQGWA